MKQHTEIDTNIVTDRYTSIMQTAERLFGEKGYRGVSIDEIAKAAGVSKGLVLYHFNSKKALLERILKDGMTTLLAEIDTSVRSRGTVKAKLRSMVKAHITILNSRPYLVRIGFFEGVFGGELKDIISTFSEELGLKIDMLVKEGVAKGVFRPVDSRIVTPLLLGMIIGLPMQATVLPQSQLSVDQMANEVTELFYKGLCL